MEIRKCQNCHNKFTIEPDDFSFYEKIKVSPPTFCPECRLQRRLAWMPSIILFKRDCDLCGKNGFSMYEQNAPFKVYCHKCWWSDKWDPKSYGMEIDFSKPFLEQWNELLHNTPILGLAIDTISGELSPYTNHCSNAKNSYLTYYSDYGEDSAFGYQLTHSKNVFNSGSVMESDTIYDSSNIFKSFNIIGGASNNTTSYDCVFIRDCEGAHHCFIAANLRNQSYVFMGEKITKEEYERKIEEIDLGSYKQYRFWKEKAEEYFKNSIPRPKWETLAVNSTGSYVFQSKNCKECYDVTDCEDSKYLMLIKEGPVKDCFDYTDWGNNASLIYDSVTVGEFASDIKFSQHCSTNVKNIEYSKLQLGGSDCFGCVSMKKGKYSILNKEYSREDYFILKEKIIQNMENNPYKDSSGRVYKYGEFFPMEFSPHAYNNSLANFFFSKTKEWAVGQGLIWHDLNIKDYPITMKNEDIPDNIKDAKDNILNEIIQCNNCIRGFKIIHDELQFLRKHKLPLPRMCPFCRIEEKINNSILTMKIYNRKCNKCDATFTTHYSKERAPTIYCIECYKKEYF